jgi:Putative peptidoglycan binding domain
MKALLLGSLAVALAQPAFAGSAPPAQTAAEKFGTAVHLNYTRMAGGARTASGYHGGYHGGYYGHGYGYRYPYYGYGYGYGYPYAAAFAFGLGLPLAYSAGYYAGGYYPYYNGYYPAYYNGYYGGAPGYGVYQQRVYARSSSARRSNSHSGGSFVTSVQSALKSNGYYSGSVDGVFGPQSQQALTAFQHANSLSETGLLDAPSLTALGVGLKSGKQTAAATTNRPTAPAPRTPTTEGTFVPPPTEAPVQPPGISNETAPQPIEPPPIIQATPAATAPTQ